MKRLSRSDSSMMVAQQLRLLPIAELAAEIAQCACRTEYRGERRLQVVRDRGQKRRAQPLRFGSALDPIHLLDQPYPLDREGALVAQGVHQPALIGREQRARFITIYSHDANGAAPGMHRQEKPLGAGQSIGAAASGAVIFPGPFGGCDVGLIEDIFGGIAGS